MELIRSLRIRITQYTVTCFSCATGVDTIIPAEADYSVTQTLFLLSQFWILHKKNTDKVNFSSNAPHRTSGPARFSPQWYDLRCFQVQDLTDEPKLLSRCQFPLGGKPLSCRGLGCREQARALGQTVEGSSVQSLAKTYGPVHSFQLYIHLELLLESI